MNVIDPRIQLRLKIDEVETQLDQFSKDSNLRVDVSWNEIFQQWWISFTNERFKVGYVYRLNREDLLKCDSDYIVDTIIAAIKKSNIV